MTGKDLFDARTKKYLSQSDLAHKLGVAPSQISRWERSGSISPRYQRKLRTILFNDDLPMVPEEQTADLRELIEAYKEQIRLLKADNERLQTIIGRSANPKTDGGEGGENKKMSGVL